MLFSSAAGLVALFSAVRSIESRIIIAISAVLAITSSFFLHPLGAFVLPPVVCWGMWLWAERHWVGIRSAQTWFYLPLGVSGAIVGILQLYVWIKGS